MIFSIYINNKQILCGDFVCTLKKNREGFSKFKIIGVEYGSLYNEYIDFDEDFNIILKDFISEWGQNKDFDEIILEDAYLTDKVVRLRDNVIDYYGEFEHYYEKRH